MIRLTCKEVEDENDDEDEDEDEYPRVSPRNGHSAYGTRGKITHCGDRVMPTCIFIVMTSF